MEKGTNTDRPVNFVLLVLVLVLGKTVSTSWSICSVDKCLGGDGGSGCLGFVILLLLFLFGVGVVLVVGGGVQTNLIRTAHGRHFCLNYLCRPTLVEYLLGLCDG